MLAVPVDPASFRATYAIDPDIRIFGPYPTALSNGGELSRVRRPDGPNLIDDVIKVPHIGIENANCGDRAKWPTELGFFWKYSGTRDGLRQCCYFRDSVGSLTLVPTWQM